MHNVTLEQAIGTPTNRTARLNQYLDRVLPTLLPVRWIYDEQLSVKEPGILARNFATKGGHAVHLTRLPETDETLVVHELEHLCAFEEGFPVTGSMSKDEMMVYISRQVNNLLSHGRVHQRMVAQGFEGVRLYEAEVDFSLKELAEVEGNLPPPPYATEPKNWLALSYVNHLLTAEALGLVPRLANELRRQLPTIAEHGDTLAHRFCRPPALESPDAATKAAAGILEALGYGTQITVIK